MTWPEGTQKDLMVVKKEETETPQVGCSKEVQERRRIHFLDSHPVCGWNRGAGWVFALV